MRLGVSTRVCVCVPSRRADDDPDTLDDLEFNELLVRIAVLHCPEYAPAVWLLSFVCER